MPTDTQDWYASWFDSPYYHLLYQHRDDAEAKQFIDKLFEFLNPTDTGRVLDLACGKGRHSVHIHSMGCNVTGLDLSEESIAYAKKSEEPTLQFLVHDMRNEFGSDEYDVVLNLFTSFGYFEDEEDDLQVLKNVSEALKAGGTFVLDFMNAKKEINNIVPEETKEAGGTTFHIRREVKDGYILKHIAFRAKGKELEFTERVRAYSKEELEVLLGKAGLALKETFGDYELTPFDEAHSPRLVLVAAPTKND